MSFQNLSVITFIFLFLSAGARPAFPAIWLTVATGGILLLKEQLSANIWLQWSILSVLFQFSSKVKWTAKFWLFTLPPLLNLTAQSNKTAAFSKKKNTKRLLPQALFETSGEYCAMAQKVNYNESSKSQNCLFQVSTTSVASNPPPFLSGRRKRVDRWAKAISHSLKEGTAPRLCIKVTKLLWKRILTTGLLQKQKIRMQSAFEWAHKKSCIIHIFMCARRISFEHDCLISCAKLEPLVGGGGCIFRFAQLISF